MGCKNQGQDLVVLASTAAIALAQDKTAEEIGLLGDLFNLIGDALSVMADKQEICAASTESTQYKCVKEM